MKATVESRLAEIAAAIRQQTASMEKLITILVAKKKTAREKVGKTKTISKEQEKK